ARRTVFPVFLPADTLCPVKIRKKCFMTLAFRKICAIFCLVKRFSWHGPEGTFSRFSRGIFAVGRGPVSGPMRFPKTNKISGGQNNNLPEQKKEKKDEDP
ncbi:MAG: hypothetical protein J6331_09935, partial [Lentisphaeria bacterium]|nr:hypothetical protein [Lentisphaeria bacterium]